MAKSQMFAPHTIKRFTSVHSWIGIFTGMALFIAFFAGALTLYAGAMHQWANPELRRSSGGMLQIEALVASVAANPAAKGNFSVSIDGPGPSASFFEGERGGSGRGSFKQHNVAFDDSMRIADRKVVSGIDHFINEIHYTIGLPKRPGYTLMGFVSAVYFLALVTGVLIHLPHLIGDLYALRVGKNLKKMWLDAHNAIGILSLPFHVMFAFTGFLICMLYMVPDVMEKMMPTSAPAQAFRESSERGGGRGRPGRDEPRAPAAAMLPPAQLLNIATGRAAGMEPTRIAYSGYGTTAAKATVTGRFRTALISRGSVELSPVTGAVTKVEIPGERSTVRTMLGGYLFLHYGEYGGELMRALYFLLGLGGAFLFYSGNLLWIETKRKRRHAEQPMAGWRIAQITIGVCIGCCLGLGAALLGTRLLPVELADRGMWERNLYYIGFFAAVMWSLARPPIRAGIELLFASAAVYAALPVLNALTTPDNIVTAVRDGLWDVAAIDAILTLFAVGFAALGRATVRRARNGRPNSVWSLTSRPEPAKPVAAAAAPLPA